MGKIGISDNGEADFTSHNMNKVVRQDIKGRPYLDYEFDTSACGTFTEAKIEKIKGKEYITASAALWKRFPEFCAIVKRRVKEGTLHTSWEILIEKEHSEMCGGKKIGVIDKGWFIGHALLGKHVPPAYPDSQLLEVAQADELDTELANALKRDITANYKEDDLLNGQATDTSALTEFDLKKELKKAIADKLGIRMWDFDIFYHFPADKTVWVHLWEAKSQLDIIVFTYTVENDEVTVGEPTITKLSVSVSEINTTVASLNEKIKTQAESLVKANEDITALSEYKEKFEQAEQEKVKRELSEKRETLKTYALKSGLIAEAELSENQALAEAMSSLNKEAIDIVIAERFMQKQESTKPSVEAASVAHIRTNFESDGNVASASEIMSGFLRNK